jgi:anthranilate/para-aminobenzoate synthase component II
VPVFAEPPADLDTTLYDSLAYNLVQYLGEFGATLQVVRNDASTSTPSRGWPRRAS